jgi:hypothetical protein
VRNGPAGLVSCVLLTSALAASPLRAEPQANLGLTLGAAGRAYDHELWQETAFHMGLRGDVLFLRESSTDFGVGPYAEILTHAFDELQLGGGVSVLFPVIDAVPVVASFGLYGRAGDDDFGFEPGLATSLFFGSRSYNYSASYVVTAGLLAQGRVGLGDARETSIVIAAQLDTVFLVLPFVYLAEALSGGSSEVERIEPQRRDAAAR